MDQTNNVPCFSATSFYYLYGGHAFLTQLNNIFNSKKNNKVNELGNEIANLNSPHFTNDPSYDEIRFDKEEHLTNISSLTFNESELAFLELKLRRNQLAHNYLNGMTDTFEEINKFYIKAIIYVESLEELLKNIT